MSSTGYNRAKVIMSNGLRIIRNLTNNLPTIKCKDYGVNDDDDKWYESWSNDKWGDSHGN